MTDLKKFPVKLAVEQDNGKFYVYGSHITNFSEIIEKIDVTNDLLETNNALLVDANGHLVDANGHLVEIDGELVKINTVDGEVTDAAVTGDNPGTISAKLRGLNKQGAEMLGKNDDIIEKLTETNALLTTGNALLVDANGHLVDANGQLVEINGELVSVNTVEGATDDTAVTGDVAGTHSAKLRGINAQTASLLTKTDSVIAESSETNTLLETTITLLTEANVNSTPPTDIATGQVVLSTTESQVVPSRTKRRTITIVNTSTIDVYIGATGVTTSTGQLLLGVKGASITLEVTGAIYAIAASGTPSVTFLEEYNV